jgi:Ca2+:H+ antiporter
MTRSLVVYIFLLLFVPVATISDLIHSDHYLTFIFACIGLIPLAKLIGDSTEHLGSHYGATAGSLLNVTFGNAPELIIATSAMNVGLFTLVKASITGSILGNILLILGLSLIAGGFRNKEQLFNKENTGMQTSMLFLAIIGLTIPTILAATTLSTSAQTDLNGNKIQLLSELVAFILLAVYVGGIIFTFVTHKHLFTEGSEIIEAEVQKGDFKGVVNNGEPLLIWSKKRCFTVLSLSIIGVVITSEILVGTVSVAAKEFGFGELFVGAIIVGIIGNAAEHSSAVILAIRNKLDLSIGIASGSGTQVALFVAPTLVIIGIIIHQPFTLVFTTFELIALFLAVIILNWIAHDGKSNWFEGVMLTSVFVIIAVGFYFIG